MKPSHGFPKPAHRGFTLIELLVVIVIVAILAGLLFPVISSIREHMRRVQALNDEIQIVNAVNAFHTEYGKYPVDPAVKPGDAVFSTDNNQLFDVLRNVTGSALGNALNPRGVVYTSVTYASDPNHPAAGFQAATGVWYDPWGSPYNVALDGNYDGVLNSPQEALPGFYSDVGPLQLGVIVWSFGKNGQLGGGPAISSSFGNETGAAGKLSGSGDVTSWASH